METVRDTPALKSLVRGWKAKGQTVGFVPTMGALHAGHMQLVKQAKEERDRVLAYIFVNPLQFGPNEDLERYPRQEEQDAALLTAEGCDALYLPRVDDVYPPGFTTKVTNADLSNMLCGLSRPGHFDGMLTVVCKMLNRAEADAAYFGEKDFQQLTLIRRMVSDLDMTTRVVGVPTVRDVHGLALSSRNAYLSDRELQIARSLNVILNGLAEKIRNGGDAPALLAAGREQIVAAGFDSVDYLECRSENSLSPISTCDSKNPARLLVAAKLGKTRLIDNVRLHP